MLRESFNWFGTLFFDCLIWLVFAVLVLVMSLAKIRRYVEMAVHMQENREEVWKFGPDQLYFGQWKYYRGQPVLVGWLAKDHALIYVLQPRLTWAINHWLAVPQDDLSVPPETEVANLT